MIQFILNPIDVNESGVSFQLLVDSPTRKRGFSANCVMTRDEFVAFRKTMTRGVKKVKNRSLVIHPNLKAITIK